MDRGIALGMMEGRVLEAQKVASQGTTPSSTIPTSSPSGTSEFVPDEKPRDILQTMILLALNNAKLGKHIYAGTADPAKVGKRRAKSKVARAQRKVNRG